MGKRKRATKPPPKKKSAKLPKVFDCPFCGHEETVECSLRLDVKVGSVSCRVCGVKYSSTIHHLDAEIDVYYKWIDACEAATRRKEGLADPVQKGSRSSKQTPGSSRANRPINVNDIDDDDDDDGDRHPRRSSRSKLDDDLDADDEVEADVAVKASDEVEAVVETVESDDDDDDDNDDDDDDDDD